MKTIKLKASSPDYQEINMCAEWIARYINAHIWFDLKDFDKNDMEIGASQMYNSMLEYMEERPKIEEKAGKMKENIKMNIFDWSD